MDAITAAILFTQSLKNSIKNKLLPDVTSADNGKILGVRSGQIAKINPYDEVYPVVTIISEDEGSNWSPSKNFSWFVDRLSTGKPFTVYLNITDHYGGFYNYQVTQVLAQKVGASYGSVIFVYYDQLFSRWRKLTMNTSNKITATNL